MRDGVLPMRDGVLPMRDGVLPMRDGVLSDRLVVSLAGLVMPSSVCNADATQQGQYEYQ